MSVRSLICSAALGAGIMAHGGATAATVDVVLTSNSIDTSFQTVALEAGTWDIDLRTATVPGSPNWIAWNPFDGVSGCDGNGANCLEGWFNDYRITTSDNSFGVNLPRVTYSTPELARANFSAFVLVLGQAENVRFSISDGQEDVGQYANNQGGLSLRLTLRDAPPPPNPEPPSVIPLPAGGVLLLSAFGLMGLASRRRRDTRGA